MKKSLSITLVLAALAVFSGLGVAQQGEKQKSPTTKPAPTPLVPEKGTTVKSSKSNSSFREATSPQVVTGKVTQVNATEKTFSVEVSFSAGSMAGNFAFNVGDAIDVTYTQPASGPMLATTVRSSKSNSDFRVKSTKSNGDNREATSPK